MKVENVFAPIIIPVCVAVNPRKRKYIVRNGSRHDLQAEKKKLKRLQMKMERDRFTGSVISTGMVVLCTKFSKSPLHSYKI